ncbi:hypothetical protein AMTRI_Chr06g175010 [Amborella trichopoda]
MVGAGMKRSKVQEEEGEKCSLWARNDGEDRERDEAKANDGVLKEDAKSEQKEESVSEHKKKEEREEVVEGVAFVRVREQWNSSMFNCLGGVDNEFLSSDLEICLLGYSICDSNCLAPCITHPSRTNIRRQFNLEGSCSALIRSGCCTCIEDEEHLDRWDARCDRASHFFCHNFALCQEGRELRRRLPHPGFYAQSILVMSPPSNQAMAHGP